MANKIYPNPEAALQGVLFDGMTIMSGGFGLSGNPESLIPEIRKSGVTGLTVAAIGISTRCTAAPFGFEMVGDNRKALAERGVRCVDHIKGLCGGRTVVYCVQVHQRCANRREHARTINLHHANGIGAERAAGVDEGIGLGATASGVDRTE